MNRHKWIGAVLLLALVLSTGLGLVAWKYESLQNSLAASANQPEWMESIPVADAPTLRVLDLTLDAFAGPLHAHPLLELTWIERGAGLRFVGDSVEPFAEGDLVLVAPGAAHTWWSSGEQPRPVKARVMQLRPTSVLKSALGIHCGTERPAARARSAARRSHGGRTKLA